MEERQRYFFVPISLLRGLNADKKRTLRNCAQYGVYGLTKTKEVTGRDEDVYVKQFLYDFYRASKMGADEILSRISGDSDDDNIFAKDNNGTAFLPGELLDKAEDYADEGKLIIDEDRNGFNYEGKFTAEDELNSIEVIFRDDPEFKNMVLEYGKFRYAFNFYKMKTKDFKRIYEWAKEVEKTIPEKSPMVMIGQDKLKEFFEDDTKSEFEIMTFAIYLAIRSILGEDKMKFTTKDMILARAFGFRNIKEMKEDPPALYEKYSPKTRYWFEKCMSEVRAGWHIETYSSNRDGLHGLYVANGYDLTKKTLIRAIEKKRKAKDPKQYNAEMKRLRDEVRKELNYGG